ncbi:16S rRNA (adenine(1518)-N(6)/adenine(1519)-N(6))-dimethyltransferase RsmA [Pseudoscardovia radai]|uniref:16S rRNA (adenine(1518)-N(6)/adenine(1519)-N(6))- dimethyltransferase RsmA n=1 Tax=Pseudoscardovia radai TaxID=987066 RepID=UPI00399415C7
MSNSADNTMTPPVHTDAAADTDAGTASASATAQSSQPAAAAQPAATQPAHRLLGAADIREIAQEAGITPTKKFGQNFVIDPGTVRRIVHEAGVSPDGTVMEVGPGLGSLTLGLLETGARVVAVEIDPPLAERLPRTVARFQPDNAPHLTVITHDALTIDPADPAFRAATGLDASSRFQLVANLPYNVATPIVLTLLQRFQGLDSFLVMVQKEVADRLSATPGSKIYGAPSVKLAWYGTTRKAGIVGRNVFWPAPHVDSALVGFTRVSTPERRDEALRTRVFSLIDMAFGQRRKTLHAALRKAVPGEAFAAAGIDGQRRGETLTIDDFIALARACEAIDDGPAAPAPSTPAPSANTNAPASAPREAR